MESEQIDLWVEKFIETKNILAIPVIPRREPEFRDKTLAEMAELPSDLAKELALSVISIGSGIWYEDLPTYLQQDVEIALKTAKNTGMTGTVIRANPDNREIQLGIVKQNPRSFERVSKKFRYDPDFILEYMRSSPFTYLRLDEKQQESYLQNKELVKDILYSGINYSYHLSRDFLEKYPEEQYELTNHILKKIKEDDSIESLYKIPEVMTNNPEILGVIKNKLKTSLELGLEYLEDSIPEYMFPNFSEEIGEAILHASRENIHNINVLPNLPDILPGIKKELKDIVLNAVKTGGVFPSGAVDYYDLPKILRDDVDIVRAIIPLDPGIIVDTNFSPDLNSESLNLYKLSLDYDAKLFSRFPDNIRDNEEVAKHAVNLDSGLLDLILNKELREKLQKTLLHPNIPVLEQTGYKDYYIDWIKRYMEQSHLDFITQEQVIRLQKTRNIPVWDNLKNRFNKSKLFLKELGDLKADNPDDKDLWQYAKYTYQSWSGAQRLFSNKKNYVFVASIERENFPARYDKTRDYKKQSLARTQHPRFKTDVTLGWVRYTVIDKTHIWIDELQSDLPGIYPKNFKNIIGNPVTFLSFLLKKFIKFARSRGYQTIVMPDKQLRNTLYPNSKAPTDPFEAARKSHFTKTDINSLDFIDLEDIKKQYKDKVLNGKYLVLSSGKPGILVNKL